MNKLLLYAVCEEKENYENNFYFVYKCRLFQLKMVK